MPPEPVSGFCILPRAATIVEHLGADRVAVAVVLALELAERGGVQVEPLHAHPHLVGPQLAAGVEPLGGLGQHAGRRRGPGAARSDRCDLTSRHATSLFLHDRAFDRKFAAWHWTCRMLSSYSGRERASHNRRAGPPDRHAPTRSSHEHRDRDRLWTTRPALPLPARRARRARLDPVPGLAATSPRPSGRRSSGSARTASRTSASCASCSATSSTSASTPTSSATRPSGPRCRCWCRRR